MSEGYPIGIAPCTECGAPAMARKHRTVRVGAHVDVDGLAVETGTWVERTWSFCSDTCRDAWWTSASGTRHLASSGSVETVDEATFFQAALAEEERKACEGYDNRVLAVGEGGAETIEAVRVPPAADAAAHVAGYRASLTLLRAVVVDREPGSAGQGRPFGDVRIVEDSKFDDADALEAWWSKVGS